jgi:hypothetical protein
MAHFSRFGMLGSADLAMSHVHTMCKILNLPILDSLLSGVKHLDG